MSLDTLDTLESTVNLTTDITTNLTTDITIQDPQLFYYRLSGKNKIYSTTVEAAKLSQFFKTILENNRENDYHSEEKAFVLSRFKKLDDILKDLYNEINNGDITDLVNKYFKIWEKNPSDSCYIKEELVQAENPEQIFKKDDLELLMEYLNKKLADGSDQILIDLEKKKIDDEKDETKKEHIKDLFLKYKKIRVFNPLLKTVDCYLGMDCLSNKIYALCAIILRESSLEDISAVTGDHFFANLQKEIELEWEAENAEKKALVAKSLTAGDGKENEDGAGTADAPIPEEPEDLEEDEEVVNPEEDEEVVNPEEDE